MVEGMERFQDFMLGAPTPGIYACSRRAKWSNLPAYTLGFTVMSEATGDLLAFIKTIKK
jgi:hypothetical protein